MTNDTDPDRTGQLSRDPERIEEWAREHDVVPVRQDEESGAGERFRMVPESETTDEDERLDWDTFEEHLEGGEEVVIYHGAEAEEPLQVSHRDEALGGVDDADLEERLLEGETVETQVTETRVVESVVVEELDLESELVDTDVLEDRVVDVELLDLECTRCDLDRVEGEDVRDWFDTERYLDAVGERARGETAGRGETAAGEETAERGDTAGGGEPRTIDDATGSIDAADEYPYRGDLEVEETWAVTREFRERHVVESEITGQEVTEADTIEDYDVDAAELHRSLVDRGVFETEHPSDEVLTHYDVESEVADDAIRTTFERERRVEDEILDRKRFTAEFVDGEYLGMDLLESRPEGMAEADVGAGAATGAGETGVEFSEDLVGNTVVDVEGDEIGIVSEVEPAADAVYVDVEPGLTERIMTRLGWSDADEEDYRLGPGEIAAISDDEIRLERPEPDAGGENR